eukprot:m.798371 g.798371  ORF g.798371 m.798371 type:complete len:224 (+) comp23349_c0_seq49:310-981(+)
MAKDSMKKKVIVKTDNEGSTFDFWAVLYRVILYFSTFVSSLAMVSALAAAQREQSGSSCSNFPSGYLPCPLEIDFDRRCSTDVGAGSCDWVFIIGSVSTVVAMLYTVYTYYCLVRTRTSPSQWIVLEFIASFILAGCVLSAASIITHKIRGMCDTVTSGTNGGCGTAMSRRETDGYGDFYLRMRVTEGGAWVATICWILLAVATALRFKVARNNRRYSQSISV